MKISMIMAMDKNRLIGAKGGMPWHLPNELRYFREVTMGKPLLMGRKTYDSIGKPLSGRTNIVLTTQNNWRTDGVIVVHNLQAGLSIAEEHVDDSGEVMVIGGASLCKKAMPFIEKLYLTVIDHEFEGDVWLDSFEASQWQELSSRQIEKSNNNPYAYTCRVLERVVEGSES